MFIKSLRICNTVTGAIMRETSFHKGVNLIVDTESSSRHNKVGKTTFLKLIDVLMGAKNKKGIYKDHETNTETTALRDLINEKRIAVKMTLVENLESPHGKTVELKVDLFPKGHYYINNERLTITEYQKKLNNFLFGISNNTPTFRQLINSFVRISLRGDNSTFLRNLTRADFATYRCVYNFLFNISDPLLDKKLSQLNTELNHARESLREYKRVNTIDDIEQQRQILSALKSEYARTKVQTDIILNPNEYQNNKDKIASVRTEYTKLTDQLSEVNYRIEQIQSALKDAQTEKNRQADLNLSRRFFDEVCSKIPDINKTFEDMVRFNNKLCDNKISYFNVIKINLSKEKTLIEAKRQTLLTKNKRYLSLIDKENIDEYEQLSDNLMQLRQRIGKCEEIIDTLVRYENNLTSLQENIESYSTGGSERKNGNEIYQIRMDSFNKYFTPLAQKINEENPILVYSPDTHKFPVSFSALSGSSTGTRKSLIAAYDLAYQQFAIANQIQSPHFIVHDVVENVEGDDLRTIINIANGIDAQYIVAVLKEKLDSSHISKAEQEKLTILQLSEDDKLFEGKTVNDRENSKGNILSLPFEF